MQIGRIPADLDHPYGHERFETLATLFVSLMLVGVGLSIGTFAYSHVTASFSINTHESNVNPLPLPSWHALLAAFVTILVKEGLYQRTIAVGKSLNSQVLVASAWHHRSDALSSVLTLVAIVAAMAGLRYVDGVAGVAVAGMIVATGIELS